MSTSFDSKAWGIGRASLEKKLSSKYLMVQIIGLLRTADKNFDPRRLWKRYVFALALILGLLVVSHGASYYATSISRSDAKLINDSGRQRMLSQRILYFSQAYVQKRSQSDLKSLTQSINEFEATHSKLISQTGISPAARQHYFRDPNNGVDAMVRRFIADARTVLIGGEVSTAALERMQLIGTNVLLARLDQSVTIYEAEAQNNIEAISIVQEFSFFAAIATLLLEGMFIFWPAHVASKRAINKLHAQTKQLETAHKAEQERSAELNSLRFAAEQEALHDALTGLANRRHLEAELRRRCDALGDASDGIGIIHVDLDRFKQINDSLGHAAGDFVLQSVADVLKATVRNDDFVSRVGGDEFVIVTNSDGDRETLEAIAGRIIAELAEPIRYEGELCRFGASVGIEIGIACEIGPNVDIDRLLANADLALYEAKNAGRGQFCFFSNRLRSEAELRRDLSDELEQALEQREFEPVYQPQFDVSTGRLIGVEALARWHHPERGVISPPGFMPVLERLGATSKLDDIILKQALQDLSMWDRLELDVPRVAVNISMKRLFDPALVAAVASLQHMSRRISFEILETVFIDRLDDQAKQMLAAISLAGVDIEVDDFGTGHASLTSILELAPKRIKIARELISPLTVNSKHFELVKSVIAIARTLNVGVLAEGVETVEHVDALQLLGCNEMQGFLFSKPLSSEELVAKLVAPASWQQTIRRA